MKKIFLLFLLGFVTLPSVLAQNYFLFSVDFRDVNGNPWAVNSGYSFVSFVSSNSDSASNPYHFSGAANFQGHATSMDSIYLPSPRRSDSLTFTYNICTGSGIQSYTFDTVIVPGGHMNLGTRYTNCVPECDADFFSSPSANGYVYFNNTSDGYQLSYFWDFGDGNTSTSKDPTYNYQNNGSYDVKFIITNPYGCKDSVTKTINITNSASCYSDFSFQVDNSTGKVTFTNNSSTGTYSYYWDFADGNSSTDKDPEHTYLQNGVYPVALIISNGNCWDSIVQDVIINLSGQCNASFYYYEQNDSVVFYNSSTGAPSSFVWYFGDGDTSIIKSPVHKYAGPGEYDVLLVMFDGQGNVCDSFLNEVIIYCNNSIYPNMISGYLQQDDTIKTGFGGVRFYLIEHDTVNATLAAVDSLDFNSTGAGDTAYYNFQVCKSGTYYRIKAALLPGATGYADYLPTYATQSLFWHQADSFLMGVVNYSNVNLIRGVNPGGPGFIGGYISQGANKSGQALENIQVVLLNDNDQPVAYTYSIAGGRYEFSNLALGKYKVLIEIPGKPSAVYSVELTSDNTSSDNVDFEVNKKDITIATRLNAVSASQLKLYPNPASNTLNVDLSRFQGQAGTFTIMDISGKQLMVIDVAAHAESTLQIDISSLKNGVYFINGVVGDKQFYAKFITTK